MICNLTLLSGTNSPNIANSNRVFPGKERRDRALIWHIWIAQWLKFFPTTVYLFSVLAIFREKRVVKVGLKVKTLIRLFFVKARILQTFFKQCFCLLEYYFWWEFRQYWTISGAVRAQNSPNKSHFIDVECSLVHENFENI